MLRTEIHCEAVKDFGVFSETPHAAHCTLPDEELGLA